MVQPFPQERRFGDGGSAVSSRMIEPSAPVPSLGFGAGPPTRRVAPLPRKVLPPGRAGPIRILGYYDGTRMNAVGPDHRHSGGGPDGPRHSLGAAVRRRRRGA